MKKSLFIIGIALLVLFVVLGSLYVIDHRRMDNDEPVVFSTWGKKYSPPLEVFEITPQTAIENVKKKLDKKVLKQLQTLIILKSKK